MAPALSARGPVDGVEYITVATTRPETMLGDTGIAVSPDDPDKQKFVGKMVRLPIVDREIPIFSDWHVDAGFGTGFVKVTPAHDPNDYAMGQAHDLPQINIFDEHAIVVDGYGEFTGMDRDQCREAVVAWFEEHDLLDHVDDHEHSVMHCYRCDLDAGAVVVRAMVRRRRQAQGAGNGRGCQRPGHLPSEPLDADVHDVDGKPQGLVHLASAVVGPPHPPVFHCDACGWEDALMEDTDVCPVCGSHEVRQEEDVLDTWFSSQLWTFATQGWPDHPDELVGHHPTKVLVTARDIIALWVARMIMSSLYFIGEIPFEDVFIYATILARTAAAWSKSKGNGVDPMDLIAMYGADAMRFNLLTLVTNNQDVKFDANIDKKTHELVDSPAYRSRAVLRHQDLERGALRHAQHGWLQSRGRPQAATARRCVDPLASRQAHRFRHGRHRGVSLWRCRASSTRFLERVLRLVHRGFARRVPGRGDPSGRPAQSRLRARQPCACSTRSCRS